MNKFHQIVDFAWRIILWLFFCFCCLLSGSAAIVVIAAVDISAGTRFTALLLSIGMAYIAYFIIECIRAEGEY